MSSEAREGEENGDEHLLNNSRKQEDKRLFDEREEKGTKYTCGMAVCGGSFEELKHGPALVNEMLEIICRSALFMQINYLIPGANSIKKLQV